MNKEYVAAFSDAFLNVMPQLGVSGIKLESEKKQFRETLLQEWLRKAAERESTYKVGTP